MSQHNAPSVTYPLGRSRWQLWLLSSLWLSALVLVLAWPLTSQQVTWRQFAGLAATIGAGLVALRGWNNSPVGRLAWDGQVWRWEGRGYQVGMADYDLLVAIDFQSLMLLRIENQAHAKLWLWAERRTLPARWLDLRRAVYSPHRMIDSGMKPVQPINPVQPE